MCITFGKQAFFSEHSNIKTKYLNLSTVHNIRFVFLSVFAVNLAAVIFVFTLNSWCLFAVEGRAMAKAVPSVSDIEEINHILST